MKIVIVGLGQAGSELAKELIEAKHEITVIDEESELIENFTNHYDAIGIVGNGANRKTALEKAGYNYKAVQTAVNKLLKR